MAGHAIRKIPGFRFSGLEWWPKMSHFNVAGLGLFRTLVVGRSSALRHECRSVATEGMPSGCWRCDSAPSVGHGRPSLKCRQIPSLVADNALPWAQKKAWQNNLFEPSLSRHGPELVSLTHAAVGGQPVHCGIRNLVPGYDGFQSHTVLSSLLLAGEPRKAVQHCSVSNPAQTSAPFDQ